MSAHNFKDLTGMKFDYLTVKEFNNKTQKWVCECECGNIKEIRAGHLNIRSRFHSCGCVNSKKFIDITGKKFGKLTAISYNKEDLTWTCKCDCGKLVRKKSGHLRSDLVKSCGCLSEENFDDITGKKFGKLTAIKYNGNNKWLCHCDCGNQLTATGYDLRYNRVISCGCSSRGLKEKELYNYVKSLYSGEVISSAKGIIDSLELDIYIPDLKLAIEFNCNYLHSTECKTKNYHQQKTLKCASHGIRLIHIFEYEWDNQELRYKLENLLSNIINNNNANRVYARKCLVKEVSNIDAKSFLNKYHLQGAITSSINIGCYNDGELVGLLTLGKPRFNTGYEYEIHRLCWKYNTAVIGGTEKMFKYFLNHYNPDSVITYADISKFTGNVYTRIGFKTISKNAITEPNYVWVNASSGEVLTRYRCQKHKLVAIGMGSKDQTEDEIMKANGYIKIYNSGNIKLEYLKGGI